MKSSNRFVLLLLLAMLYSYAGWSSEDMEHLPSLSLRENYRNFNANLNRDNEKAYEFALKYLDDIDTDLNYVETAEVYNFLSQYYEHQKFIFSKAIEYQEKALKIYTALDMKNRICSSKATLSRQNIQLGRYNTAFTLALEGSNLAEELDSELCRRECMLCFEDIYYFYYKDVSKVKEYNDFVSQGASNRDEAYQQVRALNKLLTYPTTKGINVENIIKKLESICDSYGFKSITLYAYLDASLKYGFEKRGDMARYYLYKARSEMVNIKDSGYFYAAEAYYYKNVMDDRDKAISAINRSIDILSKGEFDIKNYYSYHFLKTLYEAQGDYEKAIEAFNSFFKIYERINDSRVIIQLADSQNRIHREQQELVFRKDQRIHILIISGLLLLLFLTVLLFMLYRKQKNLQLKNAILVQEKAEQDSRSKDEIIRLKRMQQYQDSNFSDKLLKDLAELKESVQSQEMKNRIYAIMREVNGSKDKSGWAGVEKSLEGINSTFYTNLVARYPDLTPNERRLCTFIHMNMSSKDISNITQQSISSINTARTRLRKKFELTGDEVSLTTFLDQFDNDNK